MCLDILRQLGCHFPKRGATIKTVGKLVSLKNVLKKVTNETIVKLPDVTDPLHIAEIKLLDTLGRLTYLASHEIAGLVIFKKFSRTLKYGVTDHAASAVAGICFMVTWFLGDFREGRRCSDMCMILKERVSKAYIPSAVYSLHMCTSHHFFPMSHCFTPLLEAVSCLRSLVVFFSNLGLLTFSLLFCLVRHSIDWGWKRVISMAPCGAFSRICQLHWKRAEVYLR